MLLIKISAALFGLAIIYFTINSAIQSFVLPRAVQDPIMRFVFRNIRHLFDFRIKRDSDYAQRDRVMAMYAPVSLLALAPVWFTLVTFGYTFLYWASGVETWQEAFTISGSSILTLGFARGESLLHTILEFSEATIGLMLVALLIAYLPTMYAAFSAREREVNRLAVRAGAPPSPIEMLTRAHRLQRLESLSATWETWETWFVELEESHTSLPALVFFRSPLPEHSWVNAAGAVMDAAALRLSLIHLADDVEAYLIASRTQIPSDPNAAIAIRAGFLALRRIADFFKIPYNPDPHFPEDAINISREEFDEAIALMQEQGMPLKEDLEQAWLDYAGWRVNYDSVLNALKRMTLAPQADWIYKGVPIVPPDEALPEGDLT